MSQFPKIYLQTLLLTSCVLVGNLITFPLKAIASPFQSQGPFVIPEAGRNIPSPPQVPGKEFSDNLDRDSLGNLDSLQVIAWDGVGGTADALDYDELDIFLVDQQVDALANIADDLFFEVISDSSALLFSTETDPNIYYEKTKNPQGDIWATPTEIDSMNPVTDVDGLEVWGLDIPIFADADRFSLAGDPLVAGFGKTSVFAFDFDLRGFTPYISTAELANAVGVPEDLFDLDGMMTFDLNLDNVFDEGDWIVFSIAPITAQDIDGGEIWVLQKGRPIEFLEHGGHLWDTEFDVMGSYNTESENINALEAVSADIPEPSSVLAIAMVMGLGGLNKIKRRTK